MKMEFSVTNHDQAQQLRRMMVEHEAALEEGEGRPPRFIVVSGGKPGVGTTTLTVNVAAALARRGKRTVLVDGDMQRGDVARMCGLPERTDVADVLSSQLPLRTAIQPGPAGLRVLAGCWAPSPSQVFRQELHDRLIQKLKGLGRAAECVLIDAGSGPTPLARAFWRSADLAVIVTTADSVALMDAYATIKALLDPRRRPRLQVVVNQAAAEAQAKEVHARLDQSCRRFLGHRAEWAGAIPLDPMLATSSALRHPAVLRSPTAASSRAMDRVAALFAVPAALGAAFDAA